MRALNNLKRTENDLSEDPEQYLNYLNKQIKYRTKRINEHMKEYSKLLKRQEEAIELNLKATNQRERDKYNKLYFFTVSRIDKLKISIYLNKIEIGKWQSKRDFLLKSL
jgi:uncharacterized protein with gpF-like domain